MGNRSSRSSTVASFDPDAYEGTWYEIARYPNHFQSNCVKSQACYHWDPEKKTMKVCNRCVTKDGKVIKIVGYATATKGAGPGELEVTFPGAKDSSPGDYWVYWTDYENLAIVGNRNKTQVWILSRTESISSAQFDLVKLSVQGLGFNTSRLLVTQNAVRTHKPKAQDKTHPVKHGAHEKEEEILFYDNDIPDNPQPKESPNHHKKHTDSSADAKFWGITDRPSKKHGDYKNKDRYDSVFSR